MKFTREQIWIHDGYLLIGVGWALGFGTGMILRWLGQ